MRIPIRKAFALLLFTGALVPVGLVAGFFLAPPHVVFDVAEVGARWLLYTTYTAGSLAVLGLVLYPPFLPFLRLRIRSIRSRLGTDRGPLYEGLAQLRNLETHANHLLVGRLARQLGDLPLAMEHLGRAFELEPQHVGGRYQFGLLMADVGQWDHAAQLFASVVQEDERHAFGDALFLLGKALFRLHQDAEALAALRRHQQLFPGSRQAHLLLARVLADAGDMEQARRELGQARRPADDGERMNLEEELARARARVTILKRGKTT